MTAQERAAMVAHAIAELVDSLIDQQAMPDDSWRPKLVRIQEAIAALSALPSGGAEGPTREQVEALRADGVKLTVPVGYYNGYHSALDAVLALYAEPATEPTP